MSEGERIPVPEYERPATTDTGGAPDAVVLTPGEWASRFEERFGISDLSGHANADGFLTGFAGALVAASAVAAVWSFGNALRARERVKARPERVEWRRARSIARALGSDSPFGFDGQDGNPIPASPTERRNLDQASAHFEREADAWASTPELVADRRRARKAAWLALGLWAPWLGYAVWSLFSAAFL